MHSSGQLLYRDSFFSWSECMYISVEGVNILNYCILLQLTMLYNTEYFGQYTWIYFSKYFTKTVIIQITLVSISVFFIFEKKRIIYI